MTISKSMERALNEQINKELYSSYLYLQMAAYFGERSFQGSEKWMQKQAKEEVSHAMRIYRFVLDRGGSVKLTDIKAPKGAWKNHLEAFNASLAHERAVTASIHGLVDLAAKEKDKATEVMLQWFVSEQVEEEASVTEIVDQLKLIGNTAPSLLMFDKILGKRGEK